MLYGCLKFDITGIINNLGVVKGMENTIWIFFFGWNTVWIGMIASMIFILQPLTLLISIADLKGLSV